MKKVLLLAACVVMATGAFAQFSWGVKSGLNISSLTDVPSNQMKTGIYVGAFAEYRFNDYISIQPEVVYSRQGVAYNVTKEGDVTTRNRIRANYINVPVLARLYLLDNLTLDLGPQIGFVLTAKDFSKVVDKTDGRDVWNGKSRLDKNTYNVIDFSIAMGLTYNLSDNCFVSARYGLGITNFFDKDKTGVNGKNSVIQIGTGFTF